jgi:hypothetical protein
MKLIITAFTKLSLVALLLCHSPCFAQTTISVSGKVSDVETKTPLSFASISIMNKPLGTMTNAEGEFDFNLPIEFSNDSIVITHLGYKTYRNKISALAKGDKSIFMKAAPLQLTEVIVEEKRLTGKYIVAMAKKNLTQNYPTKPFCAEGFFREIEEENGKYVLLMEAALELYDKGFDGKPKHTFEESVQIKEMRKSLHYSSQKNRNNIGISLTDLIENNDIRYNRGMLDTSYYSYVLDTVLSYDDRIVYGITASGKTDVGTLYIDQETFGILKISMERKSRDNNEKYYYIDRGQGSFQQGRVWFRFTVEYELFNNKLYPKRMHESEFNERFDKKSKELKISSTETMEFIITGIYENKESKEAKLLRYGQTLRTTPYNEQFWKNYNTLKLTPLNKRLIADLEKEMPLEKQYLIQK